jgi:cytochrome c peroxidase
LTVASSVGSNANANFTLGQVWNLKQAVGAMGEVQLGAKLSDKEENDMVVLTRSWPTDQNPAF